MEYKCQRQRHIVVLRRSITDLSEPNHHFFLLEFVLSVFGSIPISP